MHYCGLDVSTKSTHVCIETAQGPRVKQTVVATTPMALHAVLAAYVATG